MRLPLLLQALTLVCASALAAGASAQGYQVRVTCAAVLTLPVPAEAEPVVFIRDAATPWRPAQFTPQGGRVVIPLDPASFAGGRARLLINPPPGVDIHDAHPPRLVRVQVDALARAPERDIALGPVARPPRRLVLVAEDRENALDPASLRLTLNGRPLRARLRVEHAGPRALWVRAYLPALGYGEHIIRYALADASPQANRLEGRISFGHYDMTNLVLAAHGTRLTADSHFVNYPSLDCLQDGEAPPPGDSLPNAISWASAETNSPHWVEVDFGRLREIREVVVHWASYTHQINTSRTFEVQAPENGDWRAVYRSPEEGEPEALFTRAEFEPLTVRRFRVWQPAGGGGTARPNLMWLTEIEAR